MTKFIFMILVLFMGTFIKFFATAKFEPLVNNHYLNTSYPIHTTSIERIATYTNGCYRQRIIEPDLWNSKRFFETEQLVCPPAVNASTFTMLTQQLQLNSTSTNHTKHFLPANNTPIPMLPSPAFVPANNLINVPQNVTYTPHVTAAKYNPAVLIPPPAVPSLPLQPINPYNNPLQSYIPATIISNATSHAAVLSKKTGFYGHEKKKSSAATINNFNWVFMFLIVKIILTVNKYCLHRW